MEELDAHPHALAPRYRIHTVAELTGVPAPTLRAWERRYGLPAPQRGPNAYRLYSNRDVTLLRRARALCEQGLAPSEAARVARSELESLGAGGGAGSAGREERRAALSLDEARADILIATRALDEEALTRAVERALAIGSAWDVYEGALRPALLEVGEWWAQDSACVAHEHLLSRVAEEALGRLLRLTRPPRPRRRLLFACVEGELHDLPLRALALRASQAGFLPLILGANTPPSALAAAVEGLAPDVVVLSATTALTGRGQEARAPSLLGEYARACGGCPWLIGGRAPRQWFAEGARRAARGGGGHALEPFAENITLEDDRFEERLEALLGAAGAPR